MDKRPKLNKNIKIEDFKDFYWLKEELVEFCRIDGLNKQGGKIELADRIEEYLKTGKITHKPEESKSKAKSKFDWNREALTLKTIITDNYKNTKKVRDFFAEHIGKQFKFNVIFMNWMKSKNGQTLQTAITEWKRIDAEKKSNKNQKVIAPQFEYNRYIRDFLKNNPDKTRETAIQYWKIKKSMRGNNVYNNSDLEMKIHENKA